MRAEITYVAIIIRYQDIVMQILSHKPRRITAAFASRYFYNDMMNNNLSQKHWVGEYLLNTNVQ